MSGKLNSKTINFVSLGCAKNLVDSEKLIGKLNAAGYQVFFESPDQSAGIVVVNTCGFIADAKEESIDAILQNAELKKNGKIQTLIVMGCLSERYKHELKNEINEIDAIFGVNDFDSIAKYLNVSFRDDGFYRTLTTPKHYAYLKIAEGCNRRCAFCAIPLIRGKHISFPLESILEEARFLVAQGVKELILVAQDTTYYGLDIYKKRLLPVLLEKLTLIDGLEWIRINYTYPAAFPVRILNIMKDEQKICNYIDIPLQHISDNVLKTMDRGVTKKQTYKLIERIRKANPDVSIRTSFIVGYPTETEQDFMELYEFIREMKFDRVGVFQYSHEEQTPAFRFKDKVSSKVKQTRYEAIMELQQSISLDLNKSKIGLTYKVLVDSYDNEQYTGRTFADAPEVDNDVVIKSLYELKEGYFYDVMINDADAYSLYGSPI